MNIANVVLDSRGIARFKQTHDFGMLFICLPEVSDKSCFLHGSGLSSNKKTIELVDVAHQTLISAAGMIAIVKLRLKFVMKPVQSFIDSKIDGFLQKMHLLDVSVRNIGNGKVCCAAVKGTQYFDYLSRFVLRKMLNEESAARDAFQITVSSQLDKRLANRCPAYPYCIANLLLGDFLRIGHLAFRNELSNVVVNVIL